MDRNNAMAGVIEYLKATAKDPVAVGTENLDSQATFQLFM